MQKHYRIFPTGAQAECRIFGGVIAVFAIGELDAAHRLFMAVCEAVIELARKWARTSTAAALNGQIARASFVSDLAFPPHIGKSRVDGQS